MKSDLNSRELVGCWVCPLNSGRWCWWYCFWWLSIYILWTGLFFGKFLRKFLC